MFGLDNWKYIQVQMVAVVKTTTYMQQTDYLSRNFFLFTSYHLNKKVKIKTVPYYIMIGRYGSFLVSGVAGQVQLQLPPST